VGDAGEARRFQAGRDLRSSSACDQGQAIVRHGEQQPERAGKRHDTGHISAIELLNLRRSFFEGNRKLSGVGGDHVGRGQC
jgi:hypothetical protein